VRALREDGDHGRLNGNDGVEAHKLPKPEKEPENSEPAKIVLNSKRLNAT
jgi:hypothetical protein